MTCCYVTALSLPCCFVSIRVLECRIADEYDVHFEEIGQFNSVYVSSASRVMPHEVFVVFSVSNFTIEITGYVEQCTR